MVHQGIRIHSIGCRNLELARLAVALQVILFSHAQHDALALVDRGLRDARDGDFILLIGVNHSQLLAHGNAVFVGRGRVDEDLVLTARLLALLQLIGAANDLVFRVERNNTGRAALGLKGLRVLIGRDNGLRIRDIDVLDILIVGQLLAQLVIQFRAIVVFLAHHCIHTAELIIHGGVKSRLQRIGKHKRAGNKRGAQNHRENRQPKAQFMRHNITQRHSAHCVSACHLALNLCHYLVNGLHRRIVQLIH